MTPWGLFCSVAAKFRGTLSVFLALLSNLPLLPTVLDPVGVLPTSGVYRTIVANVWAIKISFAGVIFVVWLQRLTFSPQATPKSMDAVLIMQALHPNFVPVPTNPVHPLRWWLIKPPWTKACML